MWERKSTKEKNQAKAEVVALDLHAEYKFKFKNNIPIKTKRFSKVADLAIGEMQQELNNGTGKVIYNSYITVINNYLKMYFGSYNLYTIDANIVKKYDAWLVNKMNKKPATSTVRTHSAAFNYIFYYADRMGWFDKSKAPKIKVKGKKSKPRAAFTESEMKSLVQKLVYWSKKKDIPERSKEIRELLRDYVLILYKSGMRTGEEALNIKWKNLAWHIDNNGDKYLQNSQWQNW